MKYGIIGGVSPEAYAKFYSKLCYEFRKREKFFPEVLSYSISVSSDMEREFIAKKPTEQTIAFIKKQIIYACSLFRYNEVDAVAICCNSLSVMFESIAQEYGFCHILTPLKSVLDDMKKENITHPLVLGSNATESYVKEAYEKIPSLSRNDQYILTDIINELINNPLKKQNLSFELNTLISKYRYDFDGIILACTDLNKELINNEYKSITIDSNNSLLNACLQIEDIEKDNMKFGKIK